MQAEDEHRRLTETYMDTETALMLIPEAAVCGEETGRSAAVQETAHLVRINREGRTRLWTHGRVRDGRTWLDYRSRWKPDEGLGGDWGRPLCQVLKDEVQLISKADRPALLYQVSRDAARCCGAGCSVCGECVQGVVAV